MTETKDCREKLREILGSVMRRGLTRNLGKETLSIDEALSAIEAIYEELEADNDQYRKDNAVMKEQVDELKKGIEKYPYQVLIPASLWEEQQSKLKQMMLGKDEVAEIIYKKMTDRIDIRDWDVVFVDRIVTKKPVRYKDICMRVAQAIVQLQKDIGGYRGQGN